MNKNLLKINLVKSYPLKRIRYLKHNEISIHYVHTGEIWDRNKIVVNNIFSYKVALDITRSNANEYGPQTVGECQRRNDWPMWKETIQAELNSLSKCEVFGLVV